MRGSDEGQRAVDVPSAQGYEPICETVCFVGIINRLTCFTLHSCSALALSRFACQHSEEKEKKITHM